MTARLGSLCAGMGGLDLAVGSLLDVEHAWHAEVDPAASKVLSAHWPGTPNLGDITAVDWTAAAAVDVTTAGFPCQPFSAAGKRDGSGDERHLWPTGVLPAIGTLRPPLVVLENVPGLLTIEGGQVFARVLADLDDHGYTVAWTTVGACVVGACHHRHRIFLAATLAEVERPATEPIAHRAGDVWSPLQAVLFGDAESVKWPASGMTQSGTAWSLPVRTCGADTRLLITPTAEDAGRCGSQEWADRWASGQVIPETYQRLRTQVLTMLPTPTAHCEPGKRGMPTVTVADSRGSRNATAGRTGETSFDAGWTLSDVVYAGRVGDATLLPTPTARDATRGAGRTYAEGRPLSEVIALLPTPTAADGSSGPGHAASAQGAPDLRTTVSLLPTVRASDAAKGGPNQHGSSGDLMLPAVQPARFGAYEAAVRRQVEAFGMPAPDPTEPGRLGKPRLSPQFCEWLMGLPTGWITAHVGRSDAIRIAGNGVVWRAAAHALASLPTFQAAQTALVRRQVRAA